MKALAGLVLVAAHALAFALYVPTCSRPAFEVELEHGRFRAVTAPHDREDGDGVGPLGLRRYHKYYRGGFDHAIGVVEYEERRMPPPGEPPECSGRVVLGQRLLDDGKAGPGTIAGELATSIAAELAGESYLGVGAFERVEAVAVQWRELARHPEDLGLVEGARAYVHVRATLVFARISVPILVALIPKPSAKELHFQVNAIALLDLGNGVLQWLSDKLGGDQLATRLARRQIDSSLITTLAPPPPFTLPDGQQLTFVYCDGPAEIVEGTSGAIPFGIQVGEGRVGPPRRVERTTYAPLSPGGALAIDLSTDGANELLYELWRTGFLDRQLAAAGLDRRFNEDPTVTEFLTLRISPPRLAHPPVVGKLGEQLGLFADARVTITDGTTETIGRVWGGLRFTFAGGLEPARVELRALELTCERTPERLAVCYETLIGALRDRSGEFTGELTRTFAKLLDDIFVDQRVGASGLSADLVIRAARASTFDRSIHLELDASLVPKR